MFYKSGLDKCKNCEVERTVATWLGVEWNCEWWCKTCYKQARKSNYRKVELPKIQVVKNPVRHSRLQQTKWKILIEDISNGKL